MIPYANPHTTGSDDLFVFLLILKSGDGRTDNMCEYSDVVGLVDQL